MLHSVPLRTHGKLERLAGGPNIVFLVSGLKDLGAPARGWMNAVDSYALF
jgi:hypothetical protein